jgi:hypothetical protein
MVDRFPCAFSHPRKAAKIQLMRLTAVANVRFAETCMCARGRFSEVMHFSAPQSPI